MSHLSNISRRELLSLLGKTGAMASISWGNSLSLFGNQDAPGDTPGMVEDFPDITTDLKGNQWLAVLEREVPGRAIGLYRIAGEERISAGRFTSVDITGIAAPALAPLRKGCMVVFPVEIEDRWLIAYAYTDAGEETSTMFETIQSPGNANIAPAVAVHGKVATVVWESNRDGYRGIYSCAIESGNQGEVVRLSLPGVNSYNPSVVALPDGSLFAAWDSFRDEHCDIWGAWCRKGGWKKEKRLTSDPRIERHPCLAVRGNEVWMTWQAQSYGDGKKIYEGYGKAPISLNYVNEQRIVVARIGEEGLFAPADLFEKVSTKREDHLETPGGANYLVRPRLAFDPTGTLWLTARQSIHTNAGWLPLLWKYSGDRWEGPHVLHEAQGRWRPVPASFAPGLTNMAIQEDDLPGTWDHTRGKYRDWESSVELNDPFAQSETGATNGATPLQGSAPGIAAAGTTAPGTTAPGTSVPGTSAAGTESQVARTPLTTRPLEMPGTSFNLREKRGYCSAGFPRKQAPYRGGELSLYFGDLHDHTDLSVCQRAQNPPGKDLYANLRDIEQLDFCAITDHGYNFDPAQWQLNGEQTRNNHDPGRFVTLLGEEWTSSNALTSGGFGHHNIIFLDPYHREYYDAFDGIISPADVWDQMRGTEFIFIPHQLADWRHKGKGNPPKDWAFHHERHMPVAEIWQTRQSYEYLGCPRQAPDGMTLKGHYMQDAWDKGLIIGVIASPDHGGGHGKAGVWAKELTREGLFEAIRARHTFGTSGPKMELLFRYGDVIMGDKVKTASEPVDFEIRASALERIEEVVIFRNNEVVFREQPGKERIQVSWRDEHPLEKPHVWYYARIHSADDQLAWSSPIWFLDEV